MTVIVVTKRQKLDHGVLNNRYLIYYIKNDEA